MLSADRAVVGVRGISIVLCCEFCKAYFASLLLSVVFCSKLCFVSGNSADSDETPLSVAFHLGHHCLQKYLLTGPTDLQSTKHSDFFFHFVSKFYALF